MPKVKFHKALGIINEQLEKFTVQHWDKETQGDVLVDPQGRSCKELDAWENSGK